MRSCRLALIAACSFASFAHADVIDNTWLGGAGSWSDATKWSAGVVPNNSGTQTFRVSIPTGSVSLHFSPSPTTIDAVFLANGAWLSNGGTFNVLQLADINGTLSTGATFRTGGPGSLVGNGTILPSGVITATTMLDIGPNLTIVHVPGGRASIGQPRIPFTMRGTYVGGAPDPSDAELLGGSNVVNVGHVEARGGMVRLQGSFALADWATLIWGSGGTFGIAGTLQNVGQTFVVDASHPWWMMHAVVQGGTIDVAPGTELKYTGTFTAPTSSDEGLTLNDVTVNGTLRDVGNATLIVNGSLQGLANVLLNSAPLVSSTGTLSIGPDVTITGGRIGERYAAATEPGDITLIFNHGTLRDPRIRGASFFNDGTISVGSMSVAGVGRDAASHENATFGDGGVLAIALSANSNGGLLSVTGQLELSTPLDTLMLSRHPQITIGTFYRIVIAADGVIGEFDSITPNFEIEYRNNNTEIWARYVPEPNASLLAGAVASACARRRCRQRSRVR